MTKSPTRPTGPSGTPRKGPDGGKAADNKPAESKSAERKAADAKAPEAKAAESKASESKPAQAASTAAKTAAAPGPQPSPAVTRNPERVARAKAGANSAPSPQGGAATQNLVVAGLVGGLLAGAAFIAYDLFLRPAPDTDARLAVIESRVGELAEDIAQPGLPEDVAARLDALEAEVDAALTTAREAAERPIPDMPDMPDVPFEAIAANTSAVESLQGDISVLQSIVSGLQAEVPMNGRIAAAARLSAAEYILGALSEGRPYAEAFAVLRGQAVSADALAPLEPFAEDAAPRLSLLADNLAAELAGEEVPSEPTGVEPEAGEGGGFLQLFVDRAITVERVDAPRQDVDTGAAQGVIAALETGDAEAALAAWQALPAEVQAQSAGFGETLENLVAARAAALNIAQTALTVLANGR